MKTYTTVKSLAPELEKAVKWLKDQDCGCVTLWLNDQLAVCVGWTDGFDANDEYEIHSETSSSWCIRAGVKVPGLDRCDYDLINFPYYADGSVCDDEVNFAYGYEQAATELLLIYEKLLAYEIGEDGKIICNKNDKWETILTEANNSHRLHVYTYRRDGNKFIFTVLGYKDLFILRIATTFETRQTNWGATITGLYVDAIDIEMTQIPKERLQEILAPNYMIWNQAPYILSEKLRQDGVIRYCADGNNMEYVKK